MENCWFYKQIHWLECQSCWNILYRNYSEMTSCQQGNGPHGMEAWHNGVWLSLTCVYPGHSKKERKQKITASTRTAVHINVYHFEWKSSSYHSSLRSFLYHFSTSLKTAIKHRSNVLNHLWESAPTSCIAPDSWPAMFPVTALRAALKLTTLGSGWSDSNSKAICHCWAWTERKVAGVWVKHRKAMF